MNDALGVRGAERLEHLGDEMREARRAATAGPRDLIDSTTDASGAPSRYSMMMYGRPSGSVARSRTLTMLSWRIKLTALASEKKRSTRSLRSEHSRDSTLIATRLPIAGCTPL